MGAGPERPDWVSQWIQGQRLLLQQWRPGEVSALSDPATFGQNLQAFLASGSPWIEGAGAQIFDLWRTLLPGAGGGAPGEWPAIGPLGQQLGELQALNAAVGEYERLAAEWTAALTKVHQEALDLLSRRTAELENAGRPPRSARELYDLWVDCGEQVYARVAHSEAHCRLVADLGNAGIRVMEARQVLIERWLKHLDLPTRSEVNSLNLRLGKLEREVERLHAPAGIAKRAPGKRAGRPASSAKTPSDARRVRSQTTRRK